MLTKETEDRLKVLGFDVSKLTEAVKAEDAISLDVPKLYTEDDKSTFGSNRFQEGKSAMSEIIAKDYRSKFNIDTDSKDIDTVISAIIDKKVKDSGGEPNEQIAILLQEKEELQSKITAINNDKSLLESEFNNKLFNIETKAALSSLIPDNTKIAKEDISTLFLNTYSVSKDDQGRTVIKKGEQVLKDDLMNPLELKQVVNSFIDDRKFSVSSGMGGNDRGGGGSAKFKNMAEFMDYCDKNEIEPMGADGQSLLSKNKAENFSY